MCQKILEKGIRELHFYIMNREEPTLVVLSNLGLVMGDGKTVLKSLGEIQNGEKVYIVGKKAGEQFTIYALYFARFKYFELLIEKISRAHIESGGRGEDNNISPLSLPFSSPLSLSNLRSTSSLKFEVMQEDRRLEFDSTNMNAIEMAVRSPLDKSLSQHGRKQRGKHYTQGWSKSMRSGRDD